MTALIDGLVQCVLVWELFYLAIAWLADGMDA